ncbi:MAG: hypothetical protein AAF667_06025 [Pseudomonadota bacterium]
MDEAAGFPITRCGVAHVNREYVRAGEIDPAELVAITDITEKVAGQMDATRARIDHAVSVAASSSMPNPAPQQLKERQSQQVQIKAERNRHAAVLCELLHDRTNYRLMRRGLEPLAKKIFTPVRSAMKAANELEVPRKNALKLRDQVRDNFAARERREV